MVAIPKKQKLNFRFHNPNTPEATADYITKIFMEVNQKKLDKILGEEVSKRENMEEQKEGCCAV